MVCADAGAGGAACAGAGVVEALCAEAGAGAGGGVRHVLPISTLIQSRDSFDVKHGMPRNGQLNDKESNEACCFNKIIKYVANNSFC